MLGPSKWTYFYLYVILDVYSRYVVGWMIAERESAALAEELISQTCARQGIQCGQLTVHADRGSAMTSKPVALLLADLGVTKTHSRPHVSNDNPYSEAQFKTMKYRPDYPTRFGCLQDARAWAATFFDWYNREHHHTGLALLTPADVHFQRAEDVQQKRQAVLQAAYEKTPERFVKGVPHPRVVQFYQIIIFHDLRMIIAVTQITIRRWQYAIRFVIQDKRSSAWTRSALLARTHLVLLNSSSTKWSNFISKSACVHQSQLRSAK